MLRTRTSTPVSGRYYEAYGDADRGRCDRFRPRDGPGRIAAQSRPVWLAPERTTGSTSFAVVTQRPNNAGTMAHWIATSEYIKRANVIPAFAEFDGYAKRQLAVYREGFK